MTYASIILALLQAISALITWAREKKLIDQGADRAIAETTAAILVKTKYAKDVMIKITSLDEKQTDDVLKQLES